VRGWYDGKAASRSRTYIVVECSAQSGAFITDHRHHRCCCCCCSPDCASCLLNAMKWMKCTLSLHILERSVYIAVIQWVVCRRESSVILDEWMVLPLQISYHHEYIYMCLGVGQMRVYCACLCERVCVFCKVCKFVHACATVNCTHIIRTCMLLLNDVYVCFKPMWLITYQ